MDTPDYQAPSLDVAGSIVELTRMNTTGSNLDQSFPEGTPFGDLTFS